jgi:NAD(P)H-hydrate epimerase
MNAPSLTREQAREFDHLAATAYAMPTLLLMENAGRSVAELLLRHNPARRPVVIASGKGNNGGDGLVIARHLDAAGVDVRVWLFADPASLHGDPAVMLRILQAAGRPPLFAVTAGGGDADALARFTRDLAAAGWVVDCLLGTGLRGPVGEPLATVIRQINTRPDTTRVVAVDLPSGLDCDDGTPADPCVRADLTATFVAPKAGFAHAHAHAYLGQVEVVSIGAPAALLNRFGLPFISPQG